MIINLQAKRVLGLLPQAREWRRQQEEGTRVYEGGASLPIKEN